MFSLFLTAKNTRFDMLGDFLLSTKMDQRIFMKCLLSEKWNKLQNRIGYVDYGVGESTLSKIRIFEWYEFFKESQYGMLVGSYVPFTWSDPMKTFKILAKQFVKITSH